MLMIALFIMTSTLASIQHNILAKENPVQRKTIINKKSTKCNFPDDIIEPGPELPKYLYAPKIKRIVNTTNGIKIQWTKVQEADGYRLQRKTVNGRWINLKILNKTQYTDCTVKNGQSYRYRIYAYVANSIDSVESTGTKSVTKKFLHLEVPSISYTKKSKKTKYKIMWKKNKKADGYNIQTSTSKEFRKLFIKNIKVKRKSSTNISGIDKKKSCYVRIRAYKIEGKNIYYSAWSSMRAIK